MKSETSSLQKEIVPLTKRQTTHSSISRMKQMQREQRMIYQKKSLLEKSLISNGVEKIEDLKAQIEMTVEEIEVIEIEVVETEIEVEVVTEIKVKSSAITAVEEATLLVTAHTEKDLDQETETEIGTEAAEEVDHHVMTVTDVKDIEDLEVAPEIDHDQTRTETEELRDTIGTEEIEVTDTKVDGTTGPTEIETTTEAMETETEKIEEMIEETIEEVIVITEEETDLQNPEEVTTGEKMVPDLLKERMTETREVASHKIDLLKEDLLEEDLKGLLVEDLRDPLEEDLKGLLAKINSTKSLTISQSQEMETVKEKTTTSRTKQTTTELIQNQELRMLMVTKKEIKEMLDKKLKSENLNRCF